MNRLRRIARAAGRIAISGPFMCGAWSGSALFAAVNGWPPLAGVFLIGAIIFGWSTHHELKESV